MPNAVKFDRDTVIHQAQQLFWQRGFNGTSMRDLLKAVNLRPGSLYASIGDKETLYQEALVRYAQQGRRLLQQCQMDNDTALGALKQFVRLQVLNSKQSPSPACMLVKTIAELSDTGSKLAELAKVLLAQIEQAFKHLLQQAVAEGAQLTAPPARLSKVLQAQIIGLKTYAQLRPEDDELTAMVEDVLASLEQAQ